LLGCALISIEAPGTDLRSPYASQSDDAFNGRTLDQEVVNPILQQKRIPSTKNAYLAMFRRSVGFTAATRNGVRDKKAYDGLLQLIGYIDTCSQDERSAFLLKLLCRLVELREKSDIRLLRLKSHRRHAVQRTHIRASESAKPRPTPRDDCGVDSLRREGPLLVDLDH